MLHVILNISFFWIFSFFRGSFPTFGFDDHEEEHYQQKGFDVFMEIELSLKELYVGQEIKVSNVSIFNYKCF